MALIPKWTIAPNVDHILLIRRAVVSLFIGCRSMAPSGAAAPLEGEAGLSRGEHGERPQPLEAVLAAHIVDIIRQLADAVDSTAYSDPVHVRNCILAVMQGLRDASAREAIEESQVDSICNGLLVGLLDGTSFDIRLILSDAPTDFRLEQVVREHFGPSADALSLIAQLMRHFSPSIPCVEAIRTLSVDYFQCLAAYLIGSVSDEPFLCGLLQRLMELYVILDLMLTEAESVLSLVQSFKYFKDYRNFALIFPSVADALIYHAEGYVCRHSALCCGHLASVAPL